MQANILFYNDEPWIQYFSAAEHEHEIIINGTHHKANIKIYVTGQPTLFPLRVEFQ